MTNNENQNVIKNTLQQCRNKIKTYKIKFNKVSFSKELLNYKVTETYTKSDLIINLSNICFLSFIYEKMQLIRRHYVKKIW